MAIQKQSYKITGMRQDNLIGTNSSDKFAHEIKNLRLNTDGKYTTGSWISEKGTENLRIEWPDGISPNFIGIAIGHAEINNKLVVFYHNDGRSVYPDKIILYEYYDSSEYDVKATYLYKGNLNFNNEYPIETLVYCENESEQKIYWVDGLNPVRVINIANITETSGADNQFDFVQEVSLKEQVEIEKQYSGIGLFPPGTVKYAITYYKLNGQETHVVYDSPLYYLTMQDRGCSPEELCTASFKITVSNLDINHNFDYIRLYSIIRTSENGTPIVRIVDEKPLTGLTANSTVTFIDTNQTGEIIDYNTLLYVGGQPVIANTLAQKEHTLFLGGLTLLQKSALEVLNMRPEAGAASYLSLLHSNEVTFQNEATGDNAGKILTFRKRGERPIIYQDNYFQLNKSSEDIKVFRYGEIYKFGIQFQDKYGIWSDIIPLNIAQNNRKPSNKFKNDLQNLQYFLTQISCAIAKYRIPQSIVNHLLDYNYKKARLVCAYPKDNMRRVLGQGILWPTVKIDLENATKQSERWAAWNFDAPNNQDTSNYSYLDMASGDNPLYALSTRNLQLNTPRGDAVQHYAWDVMTFHSPDIEFDENLTKLITAQNDVNLEYLGWLYLGYERTDCSLSASNDLGGVPPQLISRTPTHTVEHRSQWDTRRRSYNNLWNSVSLRKEWYAVASDAYNLDFTRGASWPLYAFQRLGSIANYCGGNPGTSSLLRKKIFAEQSWTCGTCWDDSSLGTIEHLKPLIYYEGNSVSRINDKVYYGSINDILDLPINTTSNVSGSIPMPDRGHYKIVLDSQPSDHSYDWSKRLPYISDPVPINYKSSTHLVVMKESGGTIEVLPGDIPIYQNAKCKDYRMYLLYSNVTTDNVDFQLSDTFVPCGPAVALTRNSNVELRGLEGDSYYMRYDCLKTFPYSDSDANQNIEILSFYCETGVNLDGRYDRNRDLKNNTTVTNTNFNLINPSYTQTNNFFSYRQLDPAKPIINNFPNQITWTKNMNDENDTDAWTNITLASVLDANGNLGEVTKIINVNDNLILFQPNGIGRIKYQDNVAIPVENGTPIELATSNNVTGLEYITTHLGCSNKWSITSNRNGVFFIDDRRKKLYNYTDRFTCLSDVHGFSAFLLYSLPSSENFKPWNPEDCVNFAAYYDRISGDVYFTNSGYCLTWNELSQTFTSFYDYTNLYFMSNMGTHFIASKYTPKEHLWAVREGDCCKFFGEKQSYWMTVVCDGAGDSYAFPADKVFNTVEYRANTYVDSTNNSIPVFDTICAYNDYQNSGENPMENIRKFEIWRAPLPRANYQNRNVLSKRDRMRNPYCYITLKNAFTENIETDDRMVLHDLAVYYDMR